jgi:hypothetical protein
LITNRSILSGSTLTVFSLLILMSPFIYTSGNGRAAAFDGEKGIATEGDSFCNIGGVRELQKLRSQMSELRDKVV